MSDFGVFVFHVGGGTLGFDTIASWGVDPNPNTGILPYRDLPTTMGTHGPFIFSGYNPYIGGLKPSFFRVLGSKGRSIGIPKPDFPTRSYYLQFVNLVIF